MTEETINLVLVGGINKDRLHTLDGWTIDTIGGDIPHELRVLTSLTPQYSVGLVSCVGRELTLDDHPILNKSNMLGVEKMDGLTPFFEMAYDSEGEEIYLARDLNIALDYIPKIPSSYDGASWLCYSCLDPTFFMDIKENFSGNTLYSTVPIWTERKPDLVKKAIANSTISILDSGELQNLGTSAEDLAQTVDELIITQGRNGCVWYGEGRKINIPTYRVDRVTPCGAGDAFKAALLGQYLNGESGVNTLPYASAVASVYVENPEGFTQRAMLKNEIFYRTKEIRSRMG